MRAQEGLLLSFGWRFTRYMRDRASMHRYPKRGMGMGLDSVSFL